MAQTPLEIEGIMVDLHYSVTSPGSFMSKILIEEIYTLLDNRMIIMYQHFVYNVHVHMYNTASLPFTLCVYVLLLCPNKFMVFFVYYTSTIVFSMLLIVFWDKKSVLKF